MLDKVLATVKSYTGYARFAEPVWIAYYTWVANHPKTSAVTMVALALFGALT